MGKDRVMPRNFGEKLKFYRIQKNYTLKDIQSRTGVDAGYISKLESQIRRAPSYPIIEKLAHALQIRVSDLIDIDVTEAPIRSIQEVLIFTEYLVNGKQPTLREREAILSVIQTILDSGWQERSKHIDTIKIMEKVERLLKLIR